MICNRNISQMGFLLHTQGLFFSFCAFSNVRTLLFYLFNTDIQIVNDSSDSALSAQLEHINALMMMMIQMFRHVSEMKMSWRRSDKGFCVSSRLAAVYSLCILISSDQLTLQPLTIVTPLQHSIFLLWFHPKNTLVDGSGTINCN